MSRQKRFEDAVFKMANEHWGGRIVWRTDDGSSWEGGRSVPHIDGDVEFREDEDFWDEYDMKDVTPHTVPPATPKPRKRTVQLHANTILGPGHYEIMMPNGHYLAGPDGTPCTIRFKGGLDNATRREVTTEKFQKVYNNFKEFYP